MRRTKIVCTVGPASRSVEVLESLARAGMDVARINFSYGTYDQHAETIAMIRAASAAARANVAILQDLQGPKIRVGPIAAGSIELEPGRPLVITCRQVIGGPGIIPTTYEGLAHDVTPGSRILLDDGAIELVVEDVTGEDVRTRVIHGGLLREHKGINLPGIRVSAPSATEKDMADLRFGLEHGVDYVALSFVRSADDIQRVKRVVRESGHDTPVIAKIEKPEAVDRLSDILDVADGLMVARGDLGVEMDLARVPVIQKEIIAAANRHGVPVITATQMLESMVQNPRPTRAEVSDVANAVFDGTDAVMLSEETAMGKYPLEAVQTMAGIVSEAENSPVCPVVPAAEHEHGYTFARAIAHAACGAARDLNARAVVAFTRTGATALMVSKFRPTQRILALTPDERTVRRVSLYWGVSPLLVDPVDSIEDMLARVEQEVLSSGEVAPGDVIVVTGGTPTGAPGTTDFMKLHHIAS